MSNQIINQIINQDRSFNAAVFKSYVDNIYVKIYTAIMLDELNSIKHFITEELYQQLEKKVSFFNEKNIRQMYDELNVKSTTITNFQVTDNSYIITVKLISRYLDYRITKDTGDFIDGNTQSRVEKNNILTFIKKKDFQTQKEVRKCPGCGASISVNTKGNCAYCGATYNLQDYEYILSNIIVS